MTTTVTTPGATDAAERPADRPARWAVAGLGAGVAGIGSIVGSSLIGRRLRGPRSPATPPPSWTGWPR